MDTNVDKCILHINITIFSSFSTFQFDLRYLFFGFESFILRNLRSNSMKNSAIEKKFATRVRKKSDLNKEKGKFLTSKNFKIWQGQNLKISIFENCTNWKSENFKNLKRLKWKPKKLEKLHLWDYIKLNAYMHEMHANVHEMCARIHRSIQFQKAFIACHLWKRYSKNMPDLLTGWWIYGTLFES